MSPQKTRNQENSAGGLPGDGARYERYHIETKPAPDIVPWPNRFLVKVNRFRLAKLLFEEIIQQRGDLKAITSRPCMYGTFSGPIGGFAPRPQHCVGCLRCMTQHPETVTILHNPERRSLGDTYFQANQINAVVYEAETGSIPVRGAGYRGKFGGRGWDGMWTDMSEIVRPTRDGIHGREFISTQVNIGEKPHYLVFDDEGRSVGPVPRMISIPVPFIIRQPQKSVESELVYQILVEAARVTRTMVEIRLDVLIRIQDRILGEPDDPLGMRVIPVLKPNEMGKLADLKCVPSMVILDETESMFADLPETMQAIRTLDPEILIGLRMPYPTPTKLLSYVDAGIHIFHLTADYHGRGQDGRFVLDLIREAHLTLVDRGIRETITLIGSGGITAAEHVPKAIICGLDAVALDTPILAAMQARFNGECTSRLESMFMLPANLTVEWGAQRLVNLMSAWRDQLLEILGAMGLREVRRLRGEIGRAMFQVDLERDAFAEIEGFVERLS